ncbi:zinc-ribbon domain-containing protein, partial [Blautia sp.]
MAGVKKCPKCGNMISEGGSFCPFCGNSINDKVIIQGKNPEPYNEQDEIQRKYRND